VLFELTYNGFAVGGDSIVAKPVASYEDNWSADGLYTLTLEFVLYGETVEDYVDQLETMRAALEQQNQAVTVKHGANELFMGDPATGTAMGVKVEYERSFSEEFDTELSKVWRLRIEAMTEHPGQGGSGDDDEHLIELNRLLSYSGSRLKSVAYVGTYSFDGTTTARARYAAAFATWSAVDLGAIDGGTWRIVGEGPIESGLDEARCQFSILYELVHHTSGETGVRNEVIRYTRARTLKDDPERTMVNVTYHADIDVGTVTDPNALDTKWAAIQAALLTNTVALYGADAGQILSAEASLELTSSRIEATLPILLHATAYTFRRQATVSVFFDTTRRRQIVISVVYQTDDAGDSATDKYDTAMDTFCTSVMAGYGGEAAYDRMGDGPLIYDDENTEATAVRIYQERFWTTGATGALAEDVTFTRSAVYRHGKGTAIAAVRGIVDFHTNVDHDVETNLASLYISSIRPALASQMTATWGGTIVVEAEDVSVSPSTQRITVRMQILLAGKGDKVLGYDETISYNCDHQITIRERHDGKPNTYHVFTAGPAITATVTVTSLTIETGPKLKLEGVTPPAPPREMLGAPTGAWLPLRRGGAQGETTLGKSLEGGATVNTVQRQSARSFLWIAKGSKEVKPKIKQVKAPKPQSVSVSSR
jgi:hypothetical protein